MTTCEMKPGRKGRHPGIICQDAASWPAPLWNLRPALLWCHFLRWKCNPAPPLVSARWFSNLNTTEASCRGSCDMLSHRVSSSKCFGCFKSAALLCVGVCESAYAYSVGLPASLICPGIFCYKISPLCVILSPVRILCFPLLPSAFMTASMKTALGYKWQVSHSKSFIS